jgi:hypothetical protein
MIRIVIRFVGRRMMMKVLRVKLKHGRRIKRVGRRMMMINVIGRRR